MMWSNGSADGEYLALQVLRIEGYTRLDPVHPRGGCDGKCDIVGFDPQGIKCVVGGYFPRNSGTKKFPQVFKKFLHDLEGVKKEEGAEGFVFVTNAEISKGQRKALRSVAAKKGCKTCEIYHLERLYPILSDAKGYGLRQEVLGIRMEQEEWASFWAANPMVAMSLLREVKEMLSVAMNGALAKPQDTPQVPVPVTKKAEQ